MTNKNYFVKLLYFQYPEDKKERIGFSAAKAEAAYEEEIGKCLFDGLPDDTEDRFYPTNIRIVIPRSVAKNDNDCTELNKKVQYCCLRRHAIEGFLLYGEHYKLWLKKHGEI